ncbi:T9SS type A sorting domain-containing protein, partial [bacterium]|nr:T9SS type A sorting domain-containing protein [bacterium]
MRRSFITLVCMLVAVPLLAASALTPETAVDLMEKSLLPEGRDVVVLRVWGPVEEGTVVEATKGYVMTTPAAGYVMYIDDYPTANMFHPVRYAFIDAVSHAVTSVDAQSPPLNWEDYQSVSTAIGDLLMQAENRRAPIPSGTPEPTRSERWAVLMNGGYDSGSNHVRYWNDLSNIYITLNSVYGFADDHIIVLCSDGLDPTPDQSNGQNSDPDLDNDGDDDIMYPCLLNTVNNVFAWLATELVAGDKLFVFTTDHGSSNGGWDTYQNLWNHEELTDAHFASLLAALPQVETICTLEPCFSGGFLDNIVVPPGPIVASSACRHDEYSWAMPPDYMYDTYVFHWTAAVKGEDAYGVPVDADYNNDGLVTMDEAFLYAETHDQSDEEPQNGDYPVGVGQGISLWPTEAGGMLVMADMFLDDIGGNNNGAADPGETVSVEITLSNIGNSDLTNIVGTISSTDPYAVITQNTAAFPDLGHFEQGVGTPAYMIDVSGDTPVGHNIVCDMHVEADSAYTTDFTFSFMVGNPMNAPCGPDAYGYMAWDNIDGGEALPYAWVEIAPTAGGPGLANGPTNDDQTMQFDLPFTFRYYGQDFTRVSICSNGWIAMGNETSTDYSNSGIPAADGPANMIALNWDDLHPGYGGTQICTYYDATGHFYVVEYYNISQYGSGGSMRDTFEAILFDPAYYSTPTGDGIILVQYALVSDVASATYGIENAAETIGIQYGFDGSWHENAWPVEVGRAITYTTNTGGIQPDLSVDLTYQSGSPVPAGGGNVNYAILIENIGTTPAAFDGWLDVIYEGGDPTTVALRGFIGFQPGWTIDRPDMFFPVPAAYAAGNYTFGANTGEHPAVIYAQDSFPFIKSGAADGAGFVPFIPDGFVNPFDVINTGINQNLPDDFALLGAYPNPFNPTSTIRYALPEAGKVTLAVYDISGRLVATLADGVRT